MGNTLCELILLRMITSVEKSVNTRVEDAFADAFSNAVTPCGTLGRSKLVAITPLSFSVGAVEGNPVVAREFRVSSSPFAAGFCDIVWRQCPPEAEIDEGDLVFGSQGFPVWFWAVTVADERFVIIDVLFVVPNKIVRGQSSGHCIIAFSREWARPKTCIQNRIPTQLVSDAIFCFCVI